MKTEGDRKFLKWLFHITCSLLRSLKEKNSSWRRPRIDTQVIFVLTLLQKHHGFNLGCPNVLLSSVESIHHVWLFGTPWTVACQASLSITKPWSPSKPTSLSQWCHPTISPSVIPFSSCPQSFSASGSFQMSQLFASGGQSIGASASTSVLPMNIQDWFPLGWTGWISLQAKGLSRVFSNTSLKASILWHLAFIIVQISHPYMTTGKTIALTRLSEPLLAK